MRFPHSGKQIYTFQSGRVPAGDGSPAGKGMLS